ncbi:hypothetical protein HWV62_183 [Athelia sp. TMB]|nr:hypothetical protein HWV62_183 [Athelia sp. TMB]
MPNPEVDQLRLICNEAPTLKKARELLQLAKVKTRPGSGYHLGPESSIGLPAVCAYIASQELNSGDISQTVAQTSSCLNEKVFLKTLNTVRKALLPDEKHSNTSGMSYSDLNREYTGSRSSKVAGWMNDAERTLVLKEVLTPKFDPKSDLMQPSSSKIVKDHELQQKHFDSLVKLLNKECTSVATKIRAETAALSKQSNRSGPNADQAVAFDLERPPATPAESSLQSRTRSGTASPTKSALKRRVEDSPSQSTPQKRVVAFEGASARTRQTPHQTPIKKPKLIPATPQSSAKLAEGHAAFEAAMSGKKPHKLPVLEEDEEHSPFLTPTRHKRVRSPPRAAAMDVDEPSESERTPSPTPQQRRFRPVFLDRKQWTARDPRVVKEWPAMSAHVKNMVDLYSHPFAQHMDVEMQAV